MKKTFIAAILALAGTSAFATEYFVVVPVKNRTAAPATQTPATPNTPDKADNIQVTLKAVHIPNGHTTSAYSFDLSTLLEVTGDDTFAGTGATWAISGGSMPAGTELDSRSGVISGHPFAHGTSEFGILVTYKSKTAYQGYRIDVDDSTPNIAELSGGVRAWSDGTIARSCNEYRNPTAGHEYSGVTGDGVYRIAPNGKNIDVTCDMSTDGGGWTLVLNGTSINSNNQWYSGTGGYGDVTSGRTRTWKLADTDIQAMTTVGLRLSSNTYGITRYVKPSCRYAQSTVPTVENGCAVTYGSLAWADERQGNFNPAGSTAGGICDYRTTDTQYFQTSDSRGYGWFVGNIGSGSYRSGSGYAGGSDIVMWVK